MEHIEYSDNTELVTQSGGTLSKASPSLTIGLVESILLARFPRKDACDWDLTGLVVGNPHELVQGIAVALDPTVEAIEEAASRGVNVLITHHPPHLSAPLTFSPADSVLNNEGAVVWAAIKSGVSLICFHTALDASKQATRVLPGLLGLKFKGVLDPLAHDENKGFGQICELFPNDEGYSTGQLAARCTSVFGRQPRVWGAFDKPLYQVVTTTGSAGDLPAHCVRVGIDCLICGEIKYHDALSASQAGLSIIELGHDCSELPLVALLVAELESAGIKQDLITVIDQSSNWAYPEATRV